MMLNTKLSYGAKLLPIIFDKADWYIKKYDETKYLVFFFYFNEKCKIIFYRIRYFIALVSNVSDVYSHKYTKIKVNSDNGLPLEKILNMKNMVIPIKLFLIKSIIIIIMKRF